MQHPNISVELQVEQQFLKLAQKKPKGAALVFKVLFFFLLSFF